MKKIILSILLCSIASISYSQFLSDVTFGVKGGLNLTNLRNIHGDSDSRLGFNIGVLSQFPISNGDDLFIQAELSYSTKGEENEAKDGTELYRLNYIDFPILFKPYFSDNETEFYGLIGPKFSFLIHEDIKNKVPSEAGYHDDKYRTFDFGIVGGIGFSYERKYEIDLRYEYGLLDVVKNDASNALTNNTSNLHFTLSYLF